MRIIKLSKEVFGFDTIDGCLAFFEHVLPWLKEGFNIQGEGNHVSKDRIKKDEILIFCYDAKIVCMAKAEKLVTQADKVVAIQLKDGTRRIFSKKPELKELEKRLVGAGYNKQIVSTQGWNIISHRFEEVALEFLIEHDWKIFVSDKKVKLID